MLEGLSVFNVCQRMLMLMIITLRRWHHGYIMLLWLDVQTLDVIVPEQGEPGGIRVLCRSVNHFPTGIKLWSWMIGEQAKTEIPVLISPCATIDHTERAGEGKRGGAVG